MQTYSLFEYVYMSIRCTETGYRSARNGLLPRTMDREFKGDTLPPGRQAGVCLHITSLPGPRGIGEIGASARRFVDAMCDMQLGVWQFLPLGPTAYGDSPYQPLSTFAGNELLIDTGSLIGHGFLAHDEVRKLEDLPANSVDYGALIPLKTALLGMAARRFRDKASSAMKSEYDGFIDRHDAHWLHDYALYRILKTQHGEKPWTEWDPHYVHRDSAHMRRLEAAAGEQLEAIKIVQFLFHAQWREFKDYANAAGVRLFGDMPIYIAFDSADAWANPGILQIDRDGRPSHVAGVPPDYFSKDGQLWGNPLYAWEVHAENGYRWWIERLRASAELADIVRIDHFRGFEGYWSVPASSSTARVGRWVPGPGDAIFDAMEDALGQLPIVAEDLGVITPEVIGLRERHQLPGMVVLQFDAAEEDFDLDDIEENCVCYTGTHDNDTTVGWFKGSPDDLRTPKEIARTRKVVLAATGGTPETIHIDMIRLAFASPARLAVAPMQDYLGLGSEARINTPGTSRGNWRWRLTADRLTDDFCADVADLVQEGRRELDESPAVLTPTA
jgi:4-alpha-glucanotransferase